MEPINAILFCPGCKAQHIDEPKGDWTNPPHRTHLCQWCGYLWRAAAVATNGVANLSDATKLPMVAPQTMAQSIEELVGAAKAIQAAADIVTKGKRVKIVSAYNGQDYGRSRPALTGRIFDVDGVHIDALHGGGFLFVKGQRLGLRFDEVEWQE